MSRDSREKRVHKRIQKGIIGTSVKPRLAVFKSNKYIYAQAIDDIERHTLASASSLEEELKDQLDSCSNKEAAAETGELIAERLLDQGVEKVVFDKGGYQYHGKIKALAEAAREKGLDF